VGDAAAADAEANAEAAAEALIEASIEADAAAPADAKADASADAWADAEASPVACGASDTEEPLVMETSCSGTGSAPDLRVPARALAPASVKLPLIWPCPPVMGPAM
jgi:hypothetical protein